ncbi:MOSC domain-containing protein [Moorella sulfitireducens]|uniref:MOSC domain-containing protein n=1 Tax=Neomoorella sulfitireducens TaxID=2972948 RepID=UPI0021ACA50F|nr:MOSC domain-containing protein [Moorella sulfitireducens]
MPAGTVIGVNLSRQKGIKKENKGSGYLKTDYGLEGDAHAGTARQVSIFMVERAKEIAGAYGISFRPGCFAENITVQDIDLKGIGLGARILIGEAIVEVTEIGKKDEGQQRSSFPEPAPLKTEGIYCRVVKGGQVKIGDSVTVVAQA